MLYYGYLHIICSSKYGITAIFTLSAAQNMVLQLSSHYLQLKIWYYGYLHIICSSKYGITAIFTPYRIAVAPPFKSYKIGLLFTHKNGCESELSGAWTGTHWEGSKYSGGRTGIHCTKPSRLSAPTRGSMCVNDFCRPGYTSRYSVNLALTL